MSDVVLRVLLVLTALQQDFPEPFVCWQEGPGLGPWGQGHFRRPAPTPPAPLPPPTARSRQ